MKGRPQDYMDVGIVHFMAFPEVMKDDGPIVETLEALCRDDYFQVVEVSTVKDPQTRRHAIETVRRSNKKAAFGAHPIILGGKLNLNDTEPTARQAALDAIRKCLAEATEWGACGLVVMSGPDPGENGRAEAMAMLCASLKEICEHSRQSSGPPVVLETFDRVAYGKNCLIGPTTDAVQVARQVQPFFLDFGLILDLGHLPLLGEDPPQAVKIALPYLRHIHIGNCVMRHKSHPAYGDNHPSFGIPEGENGVDELAAFLKALLDAGYIGEDKHNIVSFEVKPFAEQTSEQVIANAKETLDAAWSGL